MKEGKLLAIYATVHGQAERIARRIAETAARAGMEASVRDVREASPADLDGPGTVVIVASVQFGRHARSVTRFVKANRARLNAMHTAFVSVSGNAVADSTRPEAEKCAREFLRITGWTPGAQLLAGGAVMFTRYNPVVRFVIRRIFAAKGMALDPRRDYDYTDWNAVSLFAKTLAAAHGKAARDQAIA